eukprot:CAMPEP_0119388788 /NCGR_PEP_ID=MMETSP1334-20130426/106512_1 /TAXON_ID=127549 /ORGANISM="Calcidiscus leptoporus, Strain RCC1130" /LENGTH=193 /DNA_ID=CAMNT_0007410873 /DNA_START=79 /DNA_END=657 /DNA_ORIENTATION=+
MARNSVAKDGKNKRRTLHEAKTFSNVNSSMSTDGASSSSSPRPKRGIRRFFTHQRMSVDTPPSAFDTPPSPHLTCVKNNKRDPEMEKALALQRERVGQLEAENAQFRQRANEEGRALRKAHEQAHTEQQRATNLANELAVATASLERERAEMRKLQQLLEDERAEKDKALSELEDAHKDAKAAREEADAALKE